MATVTSRGEAAPTPGVHQATLTTYSTVDAWTSDPSIEAFAQLLSIVDPAQAAALPYSVGSIVPLLVGDPERFGVALESLVRLDLFEALEGMHPLILAGNTAAVLAAAALAPNPAVPQLIRDAIAVRGQDLSADARDLFLTRLRSEHVPATAPARAEGIVRWPPASRSRAPVAFVGVEPPSERFGAAMQLRVVVELARWGCTIRRLPPTLEASADWLPSQLPVIGPDNPTRELRPPTRWADGWSNRLRAWLGNQFPGAQFRQTTMGPATIPPSSAGSIDTIEAFDDGAMNRREVLFLSAAGRSRLSRAGEYAELRPRPFRSLNYWTFGQVVGLRAASYLVSRGLRKPAHLDVAANLVRLARERRQVPVGVTADGRVAVEDGGVIYDLADEQTIIPEVLRLADHVYQPFDVFDRPAPDLLEPSSYTSVHPSYARGAPCVRGTRIPAAIVAKAISARRNRPDPLGAVSADFGLDPAAVRDAEDLVVRMAGAR